MCKLSHWRTCLYATCDIISYVLSRHHVSTQMCRLRDVCVRVRALKDGCLHTFWLTKTCLCVTLNIWHLVCHVISHRCSRNKVPHHDFFNLRTVLIMQLFYLQDISMCKVSHRRTCLYATCDIISYVLSRSPCFHAIVSTTRRLCACSRTKRRVSAHFLTYEDMYMFNFKHMTPRLSHNFLQVQSKQSTTSRLFLLTNTSHNATFLLTRRLHVQIVT